MFYDLLGAASANHVVLNETQSGDKWEEPEEVSFVNHAMVKIKKGDFKLVSRKEMARERRRKLQEAERIQQVNSVDS